MNDEMWNVILDGLKLKSGRTIIPNYIKNIMHFNGFDNMDVLAKIDNETIEEMEIFARNEMEDLIDPQADLQDFYNIFSNRKDKFKFVLGHKLLLKEIAIFAKEYIDRKANIKSRTVDSVINDKSTKKVGQKVSSDIASLQPSTDNINTLTDSLYSLLKRQILNLRNDDILKLKESASTSDSVTKSVYDDVSILSIFAGHTSMFILEFFFQNPDFKIPLLEKLIAENLHS